MSGLFKQFLSNAEMQRPLSLAKLNKYYILEYLQSDFFFRYFIFLYTYFYLCVLCELSVY